MHYIAIWKDDKGKLIYSEVHPDREAAIEDLDIMFDLVDMAKNALRECGVTRISIREKDDTTIKTMGCCCPDPKSHSYAEEE